MEEKEKKDDVLETEIVEEVSVEEVKKKKRKTELVLIAIIGFLLGIMIKTEALKRVTIGFDDYRTTVGKQEYNINEIEKKLMDKMKEEKKKAGEEAKKAAEKAKTNTQENQAESKK